MSTDNRWRRLRRWWIGVGGQDACRVALDVQIEALRGLLLGLCAWAFGAPMPMVVVAGLAWTAQALRSTVYRVRTARYYMTKAGEYDSIPGGQTAASEALALAQGLWMAPGVKPTETYYGREASKRARQ